MKIFILIGLLPVCSFSSFALADNGYKTFYFGEKEISFRVDKDRHLLISANCPIETGDSSCDAYKAYLVLRKNQPKLASSDGGASRGDRICTEVLHQDLIVGREKDVGVNSFCKFHDGSVVDCGSLAAAGFE